MAEAQAVNRVHRIGQKRLVTITRYIVGNSIDSVRSLAHRVRNVFTDSVLST